MRELPWRILPLFSHRQIFQNMPPRLSPGAAWRRRRPAVPLARHAGALPLPAALPPLQLRLHRRHQRAPPAGHAVSAGAGLGGRAARHTGEEPRDRQGMEKDGQLLWQ